VGCQHIALPYPVGHYRAGSGVARSAHRRNGHRGGCLAGRPVTAVDADDVGGRRARDCRLPAVGTWCRCSSGGAGPHRALTCRSRSVRFATERSSLSPMEPSWRRWSPTLIWPPRCITWSCG